MKHFLLAALIAISTPVPSFAFWGKSTDLAPENILRACKDHVESLQKIDQTYLKLIEVEGTSNAFTKALSTTGVSSVTAGGLLLLVQASDLALVGLASAFAGGVTLIGTNQIFGPTYKNEKLNVQILFPTKEDAQEFLAERAYGIDGLQSAKFVAQCEQQALASGDTEYNAKRYCHHLVSFVSVKIARGELCPRNK